MNRNRGLRFGTKTR